MAYPYGQGYSNYPSNYPSNSGPPPPPPGGVFGANAAHAAYGAYSAYNVNAGYYQQPPPPPQAPAYGFQPAPNVPPPYNPEMYQPPAIAQVQQQYARPMEQAPQPVQVPYTSYLNHTNMEIYDQQMKKMQEMQEMMAKLVMEKEQNQEKDVKAEIKRMFVDELMRRQALSGTFEITEGTVKKLERYAHDDPVVKGNPELAGQSWDAEADCAYLRKAMKGLGTNEAAIIHVVSTRSNIQRQEMKLKFKSMYGRDLIKDIYSELSGDFRETVMALFVKPAVYDAWAIKEAIYGLGTDEKALVEILMTRTNAQLKEMTEMYPDVASPSKKALKSLLEKDIREDTSGDFKRLCIAASVGHRNEITRERLENAVEEVVVEGQATGTFDINYQRLVDMNKVKQDAQRLFKAGEDRWGTDEEEFNIIFSTRDYYHLREVYNEYVKISQRDILNSIDRETSGDFKRGLRAIVMNIRCRPMFFAERLKAAMKGLGTDDKTLIRIIVSRSEIDMVQIKKCFLDITKQTLWRWIKDDTSGDYKKILQALVGRD